MKKAQINKTVLILLIVVVAVLILVWFFWGKQLVGQAIQYPNYQVVGSAGISGPLEIKTQTNFSFKVGANIGLGNASGASFNLTLPDDLNCDQVELINLMNNTPTKVLSELVILNEYTCSDNHLSFIYFALDRNTEAIRSGNVDLAQVNILGGAPYSGEYLFNLTHVEIINYTNYVNLVDLSLLQPLKVVAQGEDKGAMTINFLSKETGLPVDKVISNYEYTLKVNVTPQVNLSEGHLVLVTIHIGGVQKAQFWHVLPKLEAKSTEEVSFDYLVPETEEPLSIKVMVWEDWPKEGMFWNSEVPFIVKEIPVTQTIS